MTYSHGHYLFHYVAESGYFYFCITDKTCQRSRAFLFLNEIARRFKPRTPAFHQVLADEMYRYSEDYSTIIVRKGELDELNVIGVGSSETILGEKILYVNNPEHLSFSTISHVGETPQHIVVSNDNNNEDLTFNTTSCIDEAQLVPNKDNSGHMTFSNISYVADATEELIATDSNGIRHSKYHFVVVSVILGLIWFSITTFGLAYFVILAFIFILSVRRLSKLKDKS